jgi:D-alanine-D-alanine ligase-like ATP-grasp enzyme
MKKIPPTLGQILKKIAPRIGARVEMEPTWNIVGQIVFKSGRKRYFRYNSLDLNMLGASLVSVDKDYANFFMKKMDYPIVPESRAFFSDAWGKAIGSPSVNIDAAFRHARKIGFPVIVKPNSGSQGHGVSLVHTKRQFYTAVREIFKHDKVVLVQKQVKGKDYRLVVLDKKVISAYERIPLSVIGDGKSTILQLLKEKQRQFIVSGRDTQVKNTDPRISDKLKHQKLDFDSIIPKGKKIFLLDNANLSTGGDSVDVTNTIHHSFKRIAIELTRNMGLRLCGVDLMINGDSTDKPDEYWILEINAAPGLDHYVTTGKDQEKIVEDLYLKVLKSMDK